MLRVFPQQANVTCIATKSPPDFACSTTIRGVRHYNSRGPTLQFEGSNTTIRGVRHYNSRGPTLQFEGSDTTIRGVRHYNSRGPTLQFEGSDTTIRGVRHCNSRGPTLQKSVYLQNCREISGFLPKISREQIWPAGAVCAPLVSQRTQHSIKSPCFQYTKIKYGITAQNSDFSEDFKQVVLDFWKYRTRRYNYSIVGPSNPRGIYLQITRDYSNCCVHGSCKEDALRAYIGSLYARVLYHLARWKGSLKMHKY